MFFRDIEGQILVSQECSCFHTAETVQHAFRVCAILHNMLLVYDGLHDAHNCDQRVFWEGLDPNLDDIVDHIEAPQHERFEHSALPSSIIDMRALPAHIHQLRSGSRYRSGGDHALLRSALVQHYHYQYNIGDLHCSKNMSNETKRVLRIGTIDYRP